MADNGSNPWLQHFITKENARDVMDFLCSKIDGSALNTLLLEVFRERLSRETAADLLKRYKQNRLVQPSAADMLELRKLELVFLETAVRQQMQPVELSTAAALGTCSVLAAVHQHKVLSALRHAEVLADATNSLALHDAVTGRRGHTRHYATTARLLRTPLSPVAGHTPHFLAGCLLSAGPDKGAFIFEQQNLVQHLQTLADFLSATGNSIARFKLIERKNIPDSGRMIKACALVIEKQMNIPVTLTEEDTNHTYYNGCQFKVCIRIGEEEIEIADGGFTDWSAQLWQDRKQRTLISGLGLEYLCHLTAKHAQRKSHI